MSTAKTKIMFFKKKLPDNLSRMNMHNLQAYVGRSHSNLDLFCQYENAVDVLTNFIHEQEASIDLVAHPVLYLMRHSIELALKDNIDYLSKYSSLAIRDFKTHSLDILVNEFDHHYKEIEKK